MFIFLCDAFFQRKKIGFDLKCVKIRLHFSGVFTIHVNILGDRDLRRLIWVYTVCLHVSPKTGMLDTYGLKIPLLSLPKQYTRRKENRRSRDNVFTAFFLYTIKQAN